MTENLSGVLKAATLKAIEVRIGIRDYRQLSVCVRCAYCPKLDELTASRDDKDPASLQADHSRATEERLYSVLTSYLGRLPEKMIELFARASQEW